MSDNLDPTQREARILQEQKGRATYPRVDIEAELAREDPFWLDLRAHYTQVGDWDLERFYYKERYFEILDEEGHVLNRIPVPLDGINGVDIHTHLLFYLRRFGFPSKTLRVRVRRRGGAYYGIKTFKAHKDASRLPHHTAAPAPAPALAPAPLPTSTNLPTRSVDDELTKAVAAWGAVIIAGIGGYLLWKSSTASARTKKEADRGLLLNRREEILTLLRKQPYLYRGPEAIQRLEALTPTAQDSDDLAWILDVWRMARLLNRDGYGISEPRHPEVPTSEHSDVQTSERKKGPIG